MTLRNHRLRGGIAVLALAFGAVFGSALASPAQAAPAQGAPTSCIEYFGSDLTLYLTCVGGAQVVASPAVTTNCATITVDVTGFLPSSSADAALEAVGGGTSSPLGAIAVSATTATGSGVFNIPTSFPVGPANVLVTGTDMLGKAVSKAVPVTIDACGSVTPSVTPTAPPSTTGTLPVTGSDSGRLIGIGAGLIVLGGAAVYGSLRSRRNAA